MTTYEEKLALAAELRKGIPLAGSTYDADRKRKGKEPSVLPDYKPGVEPNHCPTRWERNGFEPSKLEDYSQLPGARKPGVHKGGRGKRKTT